MASSAVGAIVLVAFPFSDLSQAKLRPALALASSGRGDWILCQITSVPFGDPRAILLTDADLRSGSLRRQSYIRPGQLFTANDSIIQREVAFVSDSKLREVRRALANVLRTR